MGTEGKRKLRLRGKLNAELFTLYESQLALKHRSADALQEAKRVLHHFHVFLGEYPPSPEIATSFLSQYASKKPTTLYRYHSIVNGFMTWYGEKLETKIRVPETLPDYIEQSQVDKLIQGLKESKTHKGVINRNVLLIELAANTGLRRSELANLKVCDIDLQRMDLVVRQGKGQKDRIVNLAPSLATSLERYLKGKVPEEKLFDLDPGSISNIIRRVAKKAGLNLHTHSLRDYFATRLIDRGTDVEVVRRLLGHTNLNVTRRYLARTDNQRRDAINSLDRPPPQSNAALSEQKLDSASDARETMDTPDAPSTCRSRSLRLRPASKNVSPSDELVKQQIMDHWRDLKCMAVALHRNLDLPELGVIFVGSRDSLKHKGNDGLQLVAALRGVQQPWEPAGDEPSPKPIIYSHLLAHLRNEDGAWQQYLQELYDSVTAFEEAGRSVATWIEEKAVEQTGFCVNDNLKFSFSQNMADTVFHCAVESNFFFDSPPNLDYVTSVRGSQRSVVAHVGQSASQKKKVIDSLNSIVEQVKSVPVFEKVLAGYYRIEVAMAPVKQRLEHASLGGPFQSSRCDICIGWF